MKFNAGLGEQFGALGGLLGGMFGPSPTEAAQPYMGQIPGILQKYLGPYMAGGPGELGALQSQYGRMIGQPGQVLAGLGAGFKTDPGYQFALQQALGAAGRSAAAGGMAGTPAAQQQAANIAEDMANRQYQQYLANVSGLYGTGLRGLGGLEQQAYGAAGTMAGSLASYLENQAKLAAQQAQQQQSALGGIGSVIGTILGSPKI